MNWKASGRFVSKSAREDLEEPLKSEILDEKFHNIRDFMLPPRSG
jgi:hypothetical protein